MTPGPGAWGPGGAPGSPVGRSGLGVGTRGKMVVVTITAPNGQQVACEFPPADGRRVVQAFMDCIDKADADTSNQIQVVASFPTRRSQ